MVYNRIDALRKKQKKYIYYENDNKKLMSELFPPLWKRKKRIYLNMDSKNNSMHLCITNIVLSNQFFIK